MIDWNGVLPGSQCVVLIRSKLVYSPIKWALRPLTLLELLGAWDISDSWYDAFKSSQQATLFILQAPLWVLTTALASWSASTHTLPSVCPVRRSVTPPLHPAWPDSSTPSALMASSNVKADDATTPQKLWSDRVWKLPHDLSRVVQFRETFASERLDIIRHFL
jgi:hypothetical protein